METHREVVEMFHDEEAEIGMLSKSCKRIVHWFLEPNVDEVITALEALRISADKESVV